MIRTSVVQFDSIIKIQRNRANQDKSLFEDVPRLNSARPIMRPISVGSSPENRLDAETQKNLRQFHPQATVYHDKKRNRNNPDESLFKNVQRVNVERPVRRPISVGRGPDN
jgi:hypothetical protein